MIVKHSLILREGFRVRVFENRMVRRIFGPKRDENGDWRNVHNKKDSYFILYLMQSAGLNLEH